MLDLKQKIDRYTDLIYTAMREVNNLHYDSIVDPDWEKAAKDYQRVAVTVTGLGLVIDDIVTMLKILNIGRKEK